MDVAAEGETLLSDPYIEPPVTPPIVPPVTSADIPVAYSANAGHAAPYSAQNAGHATPYAAPGYAPFKPVSRRTSRVVTWRVLGGLAALATAGVFMFETVRGVLADVAQQAATVSAPLVPDAGEVSGGDGGFVYEADGFSVSFYDEPAVESTSLVVSGKQRDTTEAYYWDEVGEDVQRVPLTPKEMKLSDRARLTAVYDAAVEQWDGNPIRSAYKTFADEPALAGTVVTEDDTYSFLVVLHGEAAYVIVDDAWPEEHRYFLDSFSFTE